MSGDDLRSKLLELFSHPKDNPNAYWMTTLVEEIQSKGNEMVFRLPFVTLKGSLNNPFSQGQKASSQGQFRPTFTVSMWCLIKSGMVHKNGIVYKEKTPILFPKKTLELATPYTEDFKRLKDLQCYQSLKKLIKFGPSSDHIQFCVFDNVLVSGKKLYQVLIPCAEIARFYFFNSSNLATAILTPQSLSSEQNKLFNPHLSVPMYNDEEKEIEVVVLREGLPFEDGHIIARIAYSPIAKRSVSIIHRSMGDISTSKYIQCPFPFSEATILECNTMEFSHEGGNALLVTEIKTCTAPVPFNNLHVLREEVEKKNDKDGSGNGDGKGKPPSKSPPKKIPPDPPGNDNDSNIVPDEPGHKGNKDKLVFSLVERFKDLKNKKITFVDKSFRASRERKGRKEPVINPLSDPNTPSDPNRPPRKKKYTLSRDRKTNPGVTRITGVNKEKSLPKNAIESPSEILKKDSGLKANRFKLIYDIKNEFDFRGFKTSFINFFDVGENSDFTYLVEDAESAASVWPFLDYEKGIRRRAILMQVIADIGTFFILDYEITGKNKSSLKYFALKNLGELEQEDLVEVCTTLVHNYGKIAIVNDDNTLDSLLTENFIVGRSYHKEIADEETESSDKKRAGKKKETPIAHFASNILQTMIRLKNEKAEKDRKAAE